VYARAAEARGLWDARLEALVVDSILTGEADEELPSRIAALGWHGHGEVAVLVGTTPPQLDVDQLRRIARKLGRRAHRRAGSRLVLVGRAVLPGREPVAEAVHRDRPLEPASARSPRARADRARTRRRRAECPRAFAGFAVAGPGAARRAPSRPTTCCPSAPSRATRWPRRRSSSASTALCRRTRPTS
jgi:hypothetical protein